jgi:hypothetical protein
MRKTTREALHSRLRTFAQQTFRDYDIETLKRAYPFHKLLFDEVGLVAFKRERSVVTRMGQTLYPELAKLIASEHYSDVALNQVIQGNLPDATVNAIDRIVRDLRVRQRRPNHAQEMKEILGAGGSTVEVDVRVIADLYVGDFKGGPLFVEVKTPRPNLDICAESKSKILTFKALLCDQNPKAYLAFPYNPFVTRAAYAHSFTKRVMDMDAEVLMAEEFWDTIGGRGTFEELLTTVEAVGEEVRAEVKDA